ncbi:transcription antitermination factor NusB [Chlamydiota bacterium]
MRFIVGSRRIARECALKLLYQKEYNDKTVNDIAEDFWKIEPVLDDIREFSEILFFGTVEKLSEIDSMMGKCTLNWDMDRITHVDKNIIRIALYEMAYMEEIPFAVSINEAIDISKRYSTNESGKFINGVLDKAKSILMDKNTD